MIFNLHRKRDGTATEIVYCLIRKDLVDETSGMLGQLPDILSLNGWRQLEEDIFSFFNEKKW